MPQPFYDHFAVSNMTLQERLGRSASTLNRDSAVFGEQTRSFLQMLNYGLDAITARAATHLLNMDVLYSNNAYLLKLTEGVLLNSVKSITPPRLTQAEPFEFMSERTYGQWSSIGTISLTDGTKTNLLAYDIKTTGAVEGTPSALEYSALYCAGDYVQQIISAGFDGYTPGIFAPIYVSESYKSVWSESVDVQLEMDSETNKSITLDLAWSLDELLGMPDNSKAALVQHTPRGMTITLGDGEIFGSYYNKLVSRANISRVVITYVKCTSLAPVDPSTIKFNPDITPIFKGKGIPLLSALNTGDTTSTLRSRALSEFFAASKITSERDLVTEVSKIPFIKSCCARREYNWPFYQTAALLREGYDDIMSARTDSSRLEKDTAKFYNRYKYDVAADYVKGDTVVYGKNLYISQVDSPRNTPSLTSSEWVRLIDLDSALRINSIYSGTYPTPCVYDNATLVLSGLIIKHRHYWSSMADYTHGDVVYHKDTNSLWAALKNTTAIEPGSEEGIPVRDRCWVNKDDAIMLEEEYSTSSVYSGITKQFNEYESITQASFEAEIKGYFNIANKLGFTSVVVEPLGTSMVTVDVKYTAPQHIQQQVRKLVEDYICYEVGKTFESDVLNSMLTKEFNLSAVCVTFNGGGDTSVELPPATYIPANSLVVNINETIGNK